MNSFLAKAPADINATLNTSLTTSLKASAASPGSLPIGNYLVGSDRADKIKGGGGNDIIIAGGGNDEIYGGAGADFIDGGAGNDLLNGGAGDDRLFGGNGNDSLFGAAGNDLLMGGKGNDYLQGGAGNNILFGEAGNDTLVGGQNSSGNLDGGYGDDLFLVADGWYAINGGDGYDVLDFSGSRMGGINLSMEWGTYTGQTSLLPGTLIEIEKVIGTNFDDSFYSSIVVMQEHLIGGSGNDLFHFDSGVSTFEGGEGNDIYMWTRHSSGDLTIKYTQGHDTLLIERAPANPLPYSIATRGADLIVTFASPGDESDQLITVSGAADAYRKGQFGIAEWSVNESRLKVVGGAGQLSGSANMIGGPMNDTLSVAAHWDWISRPSQIQMTGGGGADTFRLDANGGSVTVTDFSLVQRDRIVFGDATGIQNVNQLMAWGVSTKTGFKISVITEDFGKTEYFLAGVDAATLRTAHDNGLIQF